MKRITISLIVAALALVVVAPSIEASPVGSAAAKCKKKRHRHKKNCPKIKSHGVVPVPVPVPGPTGDQGDPGTPGTPGEPAQKKVTSLPSEGFDVTNSTVSLTQDGVEFGPYADGGAAGGSLYFGALNGQPLSSIVKLVYQARYTSDGDTGGVGVPYLRVFLASDSHDAIFSPNTQPPDPDVGEGPFHTWVATAGVWRYDDDGGSGGPGTYGVNGAPFSTLVVDHGSEAIAGIYISTGFTAGTNLAALLREFQINSTNYSFGS